ncbi:hypothetical protein [Rhodococcus sp. 14-2483-1-2]|uniref:hypothetical protein n=1 Tax=Rhodococcus sp. 14-2483-1-2 TaxID=2023147 RepID=UPI00114089DE|nr:hypothetical protein [Rhodococcus sp. 14-2483-1-2]
MSTFVNELAYARSAEDPDSYIAGVKAAVRREFQRIDNTAKLDDTEYFNHSAVPDFVIKWPDKTERRLYLRNSYESIVAANDAVRFNAVRPVVLALNSNPAENRVEEEMREQSSAAPETLVADAQSFDAVSIDDDEVVSESPLAGLIRSNLARGGRGLLTTSRVSELLSLGTSSTDDSDLTYVEKLSESFLPESVARITRTARLVELALGDDFSELERLSQEDSKLDASEIRKMIPWLIENEGVTRNISFWRYVGSMVDFMDVVSLKEALGGLDLTPLVSANMGKWAGKRAYIGLENIPSDNATEQEARVRADGVWSILGSTLGVNFGGSRLHLAPSGATLRGRDKKSAVLWPDLEEALDGFDVLSVSLTGISRSISVNAEESRDVSEDVESIARSVDDTYYVRSLGLGFPAADAEDEIADVKVNFDGQIVAADRSVALADLASVALKVLRYRDPVEESVVNVLTGSSDVPLEGSGVEG